MGGFLDLAAGAVNLAESGLNSWLNHEESQNAQAFAERMASTQYQRTVADLKAAGLNPMLAYMNTNASPSVPAAQASFGGTANAFTSAHSAKAAAALADEQAKLSEVQRKLIDQQAEQAATQSQLNMDTAAKVATEQNNLVEQQRIIRANGREAEARATSAEIQAQIDQMLGATAALIGPGMTSGASVLNKALDIFIKRRGAK